MYLLGQSMESVMPTVNSLVKEFVEHHSHLHFIIVSVFNSSLITTQNCTSSEWEYLVYRDQMPQMCSQV